MNNCGGSFTLEITSDVLWCLPLLDSSQVSYIDITAASDSKGVSISRLCVP